MEEKLIGDLPSIFPAKLFCRTVSNCLTNIKHYSQTAPNASGCVVTILDGLLHKVPIDTYISANSNTSYLCHLSLPWDAKSV